MDCLETIRDLCNIAPQDPLGYPGRSLGGRGDSTIRLSHHLDLIAKMGFVQCSRSRVIVVSEDDSYQEASQRPGQQYRELSNIQLSLKSLVVKASLTETIFGCRIRRHLSRTLKAVSFPSLNPGDTVVLSAWILMYYPPHMS